MTPTPPIPPFEARANYPFAILPDGVFGCDESTFCTRFVDQFPDSKRRAAIRDGLFRLRADAVTNGVVAATQWIDGSFVESKPDPLDVDLVSFCDYDWLNNLPQHAKVFLLQLLNGRDATKASYESHTFFVPSCRAGHPFYPQFEQIRLYWRKWFGSTRPLQNPPGPPLPGHPKGFIEMKLGDAALAPAIRAERS